VTIALGEEKEKAFSRLSWALVGGGLYDEWVGSAKGLKQDQIHW